MNDLLDLKRLNIELSALCGYACVGCPNTYMKRAKGSMSSDLFKSIFEEISDKLDVVYLANFGEPLLNKHSPEILEMTRESKVKTVLSTTGATLNKFSDLEFLSSLDELIISINGFDQETYAFHQKRGDLNKVKQGLERLESVMVNSDTNYILQLVANKHNLSNLERIDDFANEYGFKTIIIKSFNVMDNSQETFEEFIPIGTNLTRYKESKLISKNKIVKAPCKEWFVINWNGDVNPCCWDYEGKVILGNVAKQGVFSVWNSEKMIDFRTMIQRKEYLDICVNCGDSQTLKKYEVKK